MVRYRDILKRLHDHDVEFVVIGGVAAVLHGSTQGTFDTDVCSPLHDENLGRIIEALRGLNPRWRFRADRVIPVDSVEKFSGFKNLYIRTDWGDLDILGEMPPVGGYGDIQGKTVDYDLDGFACRVIDIDTLLTVKRAVGRDKDKIAVMHLEALKRKSAPQSRDDTNHTT